MRRLIACLMLLPLAVLGAGCAWMSHGGTATTGQRQRSIDELAGGYKGVALGDSRSAAIRAFGKPAETAGPSTPLGSDFSDGGPLSQKNPPGYVKKPACSATRTWRSSRHRLQRGSTAS